MATAIQLWLNSARNYTEGLALLKEHVELDEADAWWFDQGENSVSRRDLQEALKKALEASKRATIARPETAGRPMHTSAARAEQQRVVQGDGYTTEELPTALATLHASLKEMLSERDYLRSRLELYVTDAERFQAAMRIADLDEQITTGYSRLDSWSATGRDPGEVPPPSPKDAVALMREKKNIESYLARHNSGARPVSEEKVAAWKAQLAVIAEQLQAFEGTNAASH